MVFPELTTPRTQLAELTYDDAAALFQILNHPDVTRFYPLIPLAGPSDLHPVFDRFRQWFNEGSGIRWGIRLKGSDQLLGTIGLQQINKEHSGNIVFALAPQFWKMGFASEAIKEVIHYSFNTLNLRRIGAEVLPGNMASENLLLKLGFGYEGLLRNWMLWQGVYHDIKMYSYIKPSEISGA